MRQLLTLTGIKHDKLSVSGGFLRKEYFYIMYRRNRGLRNVAYAYFVLKSVNARYILQSRLGLWYQRNRGTHNSFFSGILPLSCYGKIQYEPWPFHFAGLFASS